ncbi:MAG: ROK family protein [Actinobacteria bacterium]|nr:ROK family protein [Actinomycetota bacterium]
MSTHLPDGAKAVAIDILIHGPRSRAQLAKDLGSSAPTLTRLVKPLLAAGVLVETDAVHTPGRGRSSVPLDVVPDAWRFVGVKLTSESVYAVTTNLRAEVLDSETIPAPSLEVSAVVTAVAGIVERLRGRAGRELDAVGVTVGGLVEDGKTVADSPFLHWAQVPFRRLLAAEMAPPVFLANDVVGLTRAQQWFGHGRSSRDFALLTVGAGVGYGLVMDDRVVPTTVSPVSHLAIDPHGPLCPWGHRGCMSSYVTSPAMTAAVAQAHRRAVTYDEVLDLAGGGDAAARRVVDEAAHALGRAVSAITSLTGVERIILSGEGIRLVDVGRAALHAGRLEYPGARASGVDPVVVRPMDFLEWARGAAVVAIQGVFPQR